MSATVIGTTLLAVVIAAIVAYLIYELFNQQKRAAASAPPSGAVVQEESSTDSEASSSSTDAFDPEATMPPSSVPLFSMADARLFAAPFGQSYMLGIDPAEYIHLAKGSDSALEPFFSPPF